MYELRVKFVDKSGYFPKYGLIVLQKIVNSFDGFELTEVDETHRKWKRLNGEEIEQHAFGVNLKFSKKCHLNQIKKILSSSASEYTCVPLCFDS